MFSLVVSTFFSFSLLCSVTPSAFAAPTGGIAGRVAGGPIYLPMTKRSPSSHNLGAEYFTNVANHARIKHGYTAAVAPAGGVNTTRRALKRNTTETAIPDDIVTNDQSVDFSYSATISFGTPLQDFDIVLDTGSGDLWVAANTCSGCTAGMPTFDSSKSTSFKASNKDLSIQYGKGAVQGLVSTELVWMGGMTVDKQTFLSVNIMQDSPVSGTHSGILGLQVAGGVATTATSTQPFWLQLLNQVSSSAGTSPEISFFMARNINDTTTPTQNQETAGGVFTLAGTNSSLFTGDIDFLNVTSPDRRWFLTVNNMTVQGSSIPITSGDAAVAAIDTGTSLIGGPSADVAAIWASVPGSIPVPSQPGFYAYPCSTDINLSVSFGGLSWAIDPVDINLGPASSSAGSSMCLGAIFDLSAGSDVSPGNGNPGWLFGDTFLKNVYSVFRTTPLSIGFAHIAENANTLASTIHNRPPSTDAENTNSGSLSTVSTPLSLLLVATSVMISLIISL